MLKLKPPMISVAVAFSFLTQSHGNGLLVHFFAVRFQHDVFHCFGKLVVITRPIVLAQNHQRAVAEFYRLDFLTFGQIGHDAVD